MKDKSLYETIERRKKMKEYTLARILGGLTGGALIGWPIAGTTGIIMGGISGALIGLFLIKRIL